MQATLLGVGEVQATHRTRRADIGETALLLEAVEVVERALVREQTVLEAGEEHHRELEALGGVQRHHLHAVLPGLGLALTRLQHRVREEGLERRHRLALDGVGREPARRGDEFEQVLGAAFAAFGLLLAVVLEQAGAFEHLIDDLVQREALRRRGQRIHQLQEALQRRAAARPEPAVGDAGLRRGPQRAAGGARLAAHHIEALGADAARRQVDHALEGGVVVAVGDEPQIGERVLDLGALEEAQAAVHLVRHARRHERLFEGARLRVRAVEHGDLAARAALRHPLLDAVQHELGLVALVERGVEADRLARAAARPQVLAEAPRVVGDQGVGGLQDVAGRAVVLLEAHQLGVREVLAEGAQVLDPRTAPAVDRLVVVADRERRALGAHEELRPGVLYRVGVLELIHQHMLEAAAVVREQLRLVAPQLEGAQQQLGEIHHARHAAGLLVVLVELDELASRRVVAVLERFRPQALVLLLVDEPLDLARHPTRLVELLRLHQFFYEPQLVVRVEDLEALRQAGLAPVQAQQAVRDAVEGADPERRARHAEERLDAAAHLARGLVGEGDGEDAVRRGALGLDEPGDAVHQHARLAAARAGEHHHGTDGRGHGLALGVV